MHKIERYGVIALLFLLVTIVAVTFWNDSEPPAVQKPAEPVAAAPEAMRPRAGDPPAARPLAGPDARARNAARAAEARRVEPALPLDPAARATEQGNRSHVAARQDAAQRAEAVRRAEAQRSAETFTFEQPAPGAAAAIQRELTLPPSGTARAETPAVERSAPPVARATPPAAAPREIEVGPGDTLSRIAQRHLGDERRWTAIADLNGIADPQRLLVGTRLRLPGGEGAAAPASSAAVPPATTAAAKSPSRAAVPGKSRSYTVRKGEVLSQIAQRECGSVRTIPTIVALNPGLDPDRVEAGQELLLPVVPGASTSRASESVASSSAAAPASRPRNVVH